MPIYDIYDFHSEPETLEAFVTVSTYDDSGDQSNLVKQWDYDRLRYLASDAFRVDNPHQLLVDHQKTVLGLATVASSGSFADLSSKPTTLSGYGITDATSNARAAVSLTTTGSSGAASYSQSTGVLNIPNYTPASRSFNNAPSVTIVTTASAANGTQLSSTRDVSASYSATIVTTATIGGSSSGTLVLEIAATNSATAGDWTEIARFTNGQAITLAEALQSVQTISGTLSGTIPAGYYRRVRSITNSGTPSFTYNSGQEVAQ